MKIAIASDHAGYELKNWIIDYLLKKRIEHEDLGCGPGEQVDYIDYAEKAIKGVGSGTFQRAILVCGTGLGMGIVANKFKGVRATPCCDEYTAEMARRHNDSNCLTLGGRILSEEDALSIVRVWLETEFEGGRHQKRIDKIIEIEKRNFKS